MADLTGMQLQQQQSVWSDRPSRTLLCIHADLRPSGQLMVPDVLTLAVKYGCVEWPAYRVIPTLTPEALVKIQPKTASLYVSIYGKSSLL